jgi:hypothetical protein
VSLTSALLREAAEERTLRQIRDAPQTDHTLNFAKSACLAGLVESSNTPAARRKIGRSAASSALAALSLKRRATPTSSRLALLPKDH